MTSTTLTPVTLPDVRLSALLKLAQWTADSPEFAELHDAPAIAAGLVPNIPAAEAAAAFSLIVSDLVDATDLDTRGADSVIERLGRWDSMVGLTADEKATEMRDEYRETARFNAAMLISLQDSRSARGDAP